jgi:hypothetical protein
LGGASSEDAIHDGGSVFDDRAQLLAVDGFGHSRPAGVTDQARDLFDGHASVGEHGNEAVA